MNLISIDKQIQQVHGLIAHAGKERKESLLHFELVLQRIENILQESGDLFSDKLEEVKNLAEQVTKDANVTIQKIEDVAHKCEMLVEAVPFAKQISYVTNITHHFKGSPTNQCMIRFVGKFIPPSGEEMDPFLELSSNKLQPISKRSTSKELEFSLPSGLFNYSEGNKRDELILTLKVPREPVAFFWRLFGYTSPKPYRFHTSIPSFPISVGNILIESSIPPVTVEEEIRGGEFLQDSLAQRKRKTEKHSLRSRQGGQLIPNTSSIIKRTPWQGVDSMRKVQDTPEQVTFEMHTNKKGRAKGIVVARQRKEITPRIQNPPENLALLWGQRITRELPLSHEPRITFTPFDGSDPITANGPLEHRYIMIVRNGDYFEIQAKQPHEVNLGGD